MKKLKFINYVLLILSIILIFITSKYYIENNLLKEQIGQLKFKINQINDMLIDLEIYSYKIDDLILKSLNDDYLITSQSHVSTDMLQDESSLISFEDNNSKKNHMFLSDVSVENFDDIKANIAHIKYSLKALFTIINPISDIFYNIPTIIPVQNGYVSSRYGVRISPFLHKPVFHKGFDISAKKGEAVYAAAAGIVNYVGTSPTLGNFIMIKHKYNFITKYGHLSKILVHKNQFVKKGDLIGEVGNTGLSTGPHLHYEVIANNQNVNPSIYLFDYILHNNNILYSDNGIFVSKQVSKDRDEMSSIGGEELEDYEDIVNTAIIYNSKELSDHSTNNLLRGKTPLLSEQSNTAILASSSQNQLLLFKKQIGLILIILGGISLSIMGMLYYSVSNPKQS